MTYRTNSPEQTKQFAAEFAATLKGGDVVFLEGELGAGKTTFVQGLCEALGVKDTVTSPTFSIMNVYRVGLGARSSKLGEIREIVHLDFYRMKSPNELVQLGLEEWIGRSDTLVVAEWPPAELTVPADRLRHVRLSVTDEKTRSIEIV